MTTRDRFQAQFNRCCRMPVVIPEKPLTGIQKELREQEETRRMWQELEEK